MPLVNCHKQLSTSFKVIFEDLQSLQTSCGTCTFQTTFEGVQCQTNFVALLEHSNLSRCIDLTSGTVHLYANRVLTLCCFLIWSASGGKLQHYDVNLDLSNVSSDCGVSDCCCLADII